MKTYRTMLAVVASFTLIMAAGQAHALFGGNKFEQEVEIETGSVKLVREVQRGGYDVITTEELKKAMDGGEEMVIIDTMPYEDSYRKNHIPGATQFSISHPGDGDLEHR
jgi:thiosulfate/3-mercaptopyruvate sulfurtransferase